MVCIALHHSGQIPTFDMPALVTGLVITDARYGPADGDDARQGLTIDVTVPLQALVTKSQLYIPGRRSKVRSRLACRYAVLCSSALINGQRAPKGSSATRLSGLGLDARRSPSSRQYAWVLPGPFDIPHSVSPAVNPAAL